jgi:hypothetical protein
LVSCQGIEDLDKLEGPHQSFFTNLMRLEAVNPFSAQTDLSPSWRKKSGEEAEKRGLSGSVGADNPEDLSFVCLKGDVLKSHKATESLGQICDH